MKRCLSLLIWIILPMILWAHAGPEDRYLAAIPSYRALTAIPEYIFIIAHGLLIVGAIIYAVVRKYKGTIALSILSAYNHLHESLKLFISTLFLSIGITPILYISGSFYGMMFFVVACVSFIFLILLFVRKLRGFFISSFYTLFLSTIIVLQSIYYAVYYTFPIWKSPLFQEWFKVVDFEEPFPSITYYPEHLIPFSDLLENIACIAVLFLLSYGLYLFISFLCRMMTKILFLHEKEEVPTWQRDRYEAVRAEVDERAYNLECKSLGVQDGKYYRGMCHGIWYHKKRILKEEYGIDWLSPADLDPDTRFE